MPTPSPDQDDGATQEFNRLVLQANNSEALDKPLLAFSMYERALSVGDISMKEAAIPMMRRARILFVQGRVDEAFGLASVAASHLGHSRENMNIYGRILIDRCHFAE